VKELDASLAFYTKVLGMKEPGRNTIDASKGFGASPRSEDGGFELELNCYEKEAASQPTMPSVKSSIISRSRSTT